MFIKTNGPEVISETTGSETVVIHLGTGLYFSIKHAASELWAHIAAGVPQARLINARYSQDASCPLTQEIQGYLEWLKRYELIVFANLGDSALCGPDTAASQSQADGEAHLLLQSNQFVFNAYDDMQELLGLDPIHDIDNQEGWPAAAPPNTQNTTGA